MNRRSGAQVGQHDVVARRNATLPSHVLRVCRRERLQRIRIVHVADELGQPGELDVREAVGPDPDTARAYEPYAAAEKSHPLVPERRAGAGVEDFAFARLAGGGAGHQREEQQEGGKRLRHSKRTFMPGRLPRAPLNWICLN